jgi:hypothetical protein
MFLSLFLGCTKEQIKLLSYLFGNLMNVYSNLSKETKVAKLQKNVTYIISIIFCRGAGQTLLCALKGLQSNKTLVDMYSFMHYKANYCRLVIIPQIKQYCLLGIKQSLYTPWRRLGGEEI